MTVPSGIPAISAISLYDKPSNSRNTIASRNSGGSCSIACRSKPPFFTRKRLGFGTHRHTCPAVDFFVKAGRRFPRSVALEPRVTGIADNRKQPRAAVATMEAIEELVGAQERFLHHIVGVLLLTRQPTRQVVGVVQMWQDNLLKTSELICVSQVIGCS